MPGLTRYAQKKLLDHMLGIAQYSMPAGVWLGLFQTDPTDAGSLTSELVGAGYTRRALGGLMSSTSLASGQSMNMSLITLGPATGAWPTAPYAGIMDAASGGNMLIYGPLATALIVLAGDSPPIGEGQLLIALD